MRGFIAQAATSGIGLNPLYLFTGSIAAIVAVAISLRSIIKSMIERSKEEAAQKEAHNLVQQANTRAIEKLDLTMDKLADKLDRSTFDATMKLTDHDRRFDDHARRLERLESKSGN